ncbi:tetratricopeptide repeat protein [Candidatus Woesebacteria bacterium]|nr:tetratricopeptide repeat protein [Candidatus Woesebacteria bacterium]
MKPSLLVFELSLAAHLLIFIWEVIKVKLGVQRLVIAGILSIGTILFLLSSISHPRRISQPEMPVYDTTPSNISLFIEKQLTREEMQAELVYWETVLESQPSHRDVLINISQLHRALGDTSKAVYYWEQARKADPNNQIFK